MAETLQCTLTSTGGSRVRSAAKYNQERHILVTTGFYVVVPQHLLGPWRLGRRSDITCSSKALAARTTEVCAGFPDVIHRHYVTLLTDET